MDVKNHQKSKSWYSHHHHHHHHHQYMINVDYIILNFVNGQSYPNEDVLWQLFMSWMKGYDKYYENNELQQRYNHFKSNCQEIYKFNGGFIHPIPVVDIEYPQDNEPSSSSSSSPIDRSILSINDVQPIITFQQSLTPIQSLNSFSDLPFEEFLTLYTGAEGIEPPASESTPSTAAGVSISVAAIVGIAVGSFLAVAAIVASIATIVILNKKSKLQEAKKKQQQEKEIKEMTLYGQHLNNNIVSPPTTIPTTIVVPTTTTRTSVTIINPYVPTNGIDVMYYKPKSSHRSITSRSVPFDLTAYSSHSNF
ncbi:hypothetical protein DFA_07404 [Cavenderia fasciculata]|uniref:Cathepsin propeptide inhibitor domain-containing protein n=1 Tax=Cavenderia fasciculata TaxID=261658 RepID=F4PWB7_CACFS|nr:uncharacterized protein DFA_07404 [Cavenderia fasciculata]EGG20281.1 hypothetical protein DFA_07404 [Cavenderia fasciculata]|eukprot:XP_004367264.1 hypothetical protein DFA_07404 [Cavenderia fasciculata]